ncbi:hypothetical protein ACFFRR_007977 [Megaselia abdita]
MRLILVFIIVSTLFCLKALGNEQDECTTINPITCEGVWNGVRNRIVQMQQNHKCDWKECRADCIKKGYKGGCCSPCKGCVCHGKKVREDFGTLYTPNVILA